MAAALTFGLVGAAVAIGAACMVWWLRARRMQARPSVTPRLLVPMPTLAAPTVRPPRVAASPRVAVHVDGSATRVCPSCRSEHRGLTFCPRDARRLISPDELLAMGPSATGTGAICPMCARAQEPGQRRCPHDGAAWVPRAALETWPLRVRAAAEPTGVIGKICPRCQQRFDLAALFCGHDGSDLHVIN